MVVLFSGGFPLTSENQSELRRPSMLATNRTSRCMHWMPAIDCAGPWRECSEKHRGRQDARSFESGVESRGFRAAADFCWRRFRRVPCLIRSGRAAAVPRWRNGWWRGAVAGAEAVGQVVAVPVVEGRGGGVVLEELGAAPEELVVGAEAAVRAARAERVWHPGWDGGGTGGGTRKRGFNPGSNYNNSPLTGRERSCRSFQLRLRRISRFLLPSRKEQGGFHDLQYQRFARRPGAHRSEQNEFYILGYVPADTPEGSCHTIKVKLNRGGLSAPRLAQRLLQYQVDKRIGGKPLEKRSKRTGSSQTGYQSWSVQAPVLLYRAEYGAREPGEWSFPRIPCNSTRKKESNHSEPDVLGHRSGGWGPSRAI